MAFQIDGYVDVAERIRVFKAAYPQGSLQPANTTEPYKFEHIGDRLFIVVVAAAYRTPDDIRPGIGMAMEPYPGRTNFTKDSELMNAETSAWGRAIVAALAADTQKIASAQEVRNRQAEQEPGQTLAVVRDVSSSREKPPTTGTNEPVRAKIGSAASHVATNLTEQQQAKIKAMWRGLEKDSRVTGTLVEFCVKAIERDITVINELTKKEASTVIDAIIRAGA